MDQRDKIEPNVLIPNLFLTDIQKAYIKERTASSIDGTGKIGYSHIENGPLPLILYKNHLSVGTDTMKLLEQNRRNTVTYTDRQLYFLLGPQSIGSKIKGKNCIKLRSLCTLTKQKELK